MDNLYKKVVSLQNRVNDLLDDHSGSSARSLKQEVQRLEDEAQVGKNPSSLERRARTIARMLERAGDDEIMDHRHADSLADQFEDLANEFRRL